MRDVAASPRRAALGGACKSERASRGHQQRDEQRHDDESRVRTRSRYSRFATMKIFLSMAAHPLFDAGHADALEEDLME